jgi:hypothetical protein
MTKDEALNLALDALETSMYPQQKQLQAITAIKAIKEASAQPEQKPVAWIHNFIEGGISIGKRPADLERHPDRWTALYKEPKPCPTCEALARTVMLDQTSHDTTPPQRKPLRDHEIAKILDRERMKWHKSPPTYEFDLAFARAIEAAHSIKE